jgi:LysM repeat protein
MLAPAALAIVFVLVVVVIFSAGGSDDATQESSADTSTAEATNTQTTAKTPAKPTPATYTVKVGDSLGSIAQKTKLPVEKLQELNPDLDPQALSPGQKIKLRE